ncbi:MAG: LysR family transcriptional regulator [Rhizobiaceae bacterium]|nr:LysR family transcriptional regulator [Rhizobiaceae bacterium]
MARSLPPLAWFRAFECAARHLSFTLAAQELNLTQSAISQHVRSLEHKFSCALFVRKHRGIALTDQGRRLLPTVASAISILQSATETFETPTDKQLLTISVSTSLAQWYLAPRLKHFATLHPDIGFRVISKVWPDEFTGLNADVELRFDAPSSAQSDSVRIGHNRMVMVASPDLISDFGNREFSPDYIADFPLIQVLGTTDTWNRWAAERAYLENLNISCNVESHGAAVDFAKAGTGIALTSSLVAAPCLVDGSLLVLERESLAAHDGYYLTVRQNENFEIASAFGAWLQAEIAQTEAAI